MLVTQYLDKNETQLPSPEQLKRRIILKHKKLPDGADESFVSKNEDFCKQIANADYYLVKLIINYTYKNIL